MSTLERVPPQDLEAETAVLGALMLSRDAFDAVKSLIPQDFYRPAHATIFARCQELHARNEPVDPITMAAFLREAGDLEHVGGAAYLHDLVQAVPTAANAGYYAELIQETALRRGGIEEATRTVQSLYAPEGEAQELVEDAVERMRAVRDHGLAAVDLPSKTLREFLAEADDEPEWVIPNVLARWDRLIVTAGEGGGKSLFNRQMLMRTAAGLHPWRKARIQPRRALLVDVENSQSQVRPWLRKMHAAAVEEGADEATQDRFVVEILEGGLDLHRPGDRSRLLRIVEKNRPEIVAIGPLYKLVSGNPNDEENARVLMSALEAVRVASDGAALLIEAHSPHLQAGLKRRDLRPIGSSLWMRWPEFGFGLSPSVVSDEDEGAEELGLVDWLPWRGSRADRDWPQQFMRGATWPWQAVASSLASIPTQPAEARIGM